MLLVCGGSGLGRGSRPREAGHRSGRRIAVTATRSGQPVLQHLSQRALVRVERQKGSVTARADVVDGARVTIEPRQFGPVATEPTRRRGDAKRYAIAGRNRIEMRLGSLRAHGATVPIVNGLGNGLGGQLR